MSEIRLLNGHLRLLLLLLLVSSVQPLQAQAADAGSVLFANVRIFDASSAQLSAPKNVLVTGNLISSITPAAEQVATDDKLTRIDAGGRTLMPGLIDAHTHLMFATLLQMDMLTSDIG
ncbi:MAG: hypothetical protein Tsb0027_11340 [Wenzhouxiangellaceae bacterium]